MGTFPQLIAGLVLCFLCGMWIILCSCSSLIREDYEEVREGALAMDSKSLKPQDGETFIEKDWWKPFGDDELDAIVDDVVANVSRTYVSIRQLDNQLGWHSQSLEAPKDILGKLKIQLEVRQMERDHLGAQQKGLDLYAQLIKDMVDQHNALGGG